jgi:predicted ATPase
MYMPQYKVTDIADAMILRQLFEKLLNYGVVCVITSKYVPTVLSGGSSVIEKIHEVDIQMNYTRMEYRDRASFHALTY